MLLLPLLLPIVIATLAISHPHVVTDELLAKRDAHQLHSARSFSACQSSMRKRDIQSRSAARRAELAQRLRKERGILVDGPFLSKREVPSINQTHHSNATGLTWNSDPFSGTNSGCVLDVETTQGPYMINGERIRQNVTDTQEGIPLYVDFEVVDVSTCDTVPGIYLDFWHANSTGIYSGVAVDGNGAGSAEPSNINQTFLRGVQMTADAGYAQFVTIMPGHYSGRAVHLHVMAHQTDGTLYANGTYLGSTISHVGQTYFDPDLKSQYESLAPYSANTQQEVSNEDDLWFSMVEDYYDPIMDYVFLGEDISDGVLAWSTLVINSTASFIVPAAGALTENGGVANSFVLGQLPIPGNTSISLSLPPMPTST